MLPSFSVVIPCYNEAARIGETVRWTIDYLSAESPGAELIVVNDGSTDATAAVLRDALADAKIQTRLLENFPNRGKGAAVRSGLLAGSKPIGLFFDADLSTPLGEIPKLIEPIAKGEVDVAFGSRALDRRLIGVRQPWRREQAGRVFNLIVRLATRMVTYGQPPNSGFIITGQSLKPFEDRISSYTWIALAAWLACLACRTRDYILLLNLR